jgi:magnesium transporter
VLVIVEYRKKLSNGSGLSKVILHVTSIKALISLLTLNIVLGYQSGAMSEERQDQTITGADAESSQECPPEFERFHPADGADMLEDLPIEQQVEAVLCIPLEDAADFISEMERHDRAELMTELPPDHAADILEHMSPDDAADVLDDMDEEHQKRLLRRMEKDEAADVQGLMRFDPETAGGVMNTEVMVLKKDLTVDDAIGMIRGAVEDTEIPYYAYVVEGDEKLVGVLSLRDLMLSKPGKKLNDLVQDQSLITALYNADKEEVAHLIAHYNFLALPVVDQEGRLLGVVTHDDVIDIIHEEHSEDMLGMVGAGHDETFDTPWGRSVGMRLPWLVINLATASLAAWVVHQFEGTIAQMAILAALMPIVANQAGNTGHQSLAVMIRQLAMERFDRKKSWIAVLREGKIGAANGIMVSVLALIGVYLLTSRLDLAGVMAAALGMDMVLGNVVGALVPLTLKELGRDPAQASSIFVTMITDAAGFFTFLGLAALFLL